MTLRTAPVRVEPLQGAPDLTRLAQVVTVGGWQVGVADPVGTITDLPALDRLAEQVDWRAPRTDTSPPFTGGALGYLSDDLSPALVGLPAEPWEGGRFHPDPRPAVASVPPLWFGVYDAAACVDPGGQAWIVTSDLPGLTRRSASDRAEQLRVRLAAPQPPAGPAAAGRPRTSLTEEEHAAAVRRILGWIAAGDLYQLNLTLQVAASWPAGGAALARRLWAANPDAAHAALLRLPGGVEAVSVSPETFLRCDAGDVSMRPVKGTRRRHASPEADSAAATELVHSLKDQAEHVMIVDLVRNDLGAVCEVGSVRVRELAALERHPTVWHLTSTVQGRLRAGLPLSGLLAATFPCGSVTGTPKRMTVARTALVEPLRRGIYCGAIGVVSRGLVDLSVAIRTAVVRDGVASYGTGGGIVADSDPGAEWDEAMAKAAAFREALTL